MIAKKVLVAFGVVMFGAGLMVSPVQARCSKDCNRSLHGTFVGCRSLCDKGKAGKSCKGDCISAFRGAKANCRGATPPACSSSQQRAERERRLRSPHPANSSRDTLARELRVDRDGLIDRAPRSAPAPARRVRPPACCGRRLATRTRAARRGSPAAGPPASAGNTPAAPGGGAGAPRPR